MPTKFHSNGTTQNFKSMSRDPLCSNFAFISLLPLVMYLHAKFDVPSYNRSRDMEGVPKLKKK